MASTPIQLDLPGQAHVADGPLDHTGMYVMHHAFRRDLDDLVAAIASTPLDDAVTWRALSSYWRFFDELLHHHHTAEDEHYWPAVSVAVDRRGTPADRATITAMQDEHALIDPALDECRRAIDRVVARPERSAGAELRERVVELRRLVADHMTHEEAEALPLVDRVMTQPEHERVDRAIGRSHPVRLVSRMVPWALHGLPPATRQELLSKAGPPQRILLRVGRGRFERRHDAAFRRVV